MATTNNDPLASVERLLEEWLDETEQWVGFGLSDPSREAVRRLLAVAREDMQGYGAIGPAVESLIAFARQLEQS